MFYNHPFPFSFEGVDLSTAAGEKWASRTLPPRPRGCINERVAKKKVGGNHRERKGATVEGEGAAGVSVDMIVGYVFNCVKVRNQACHLHMIGQNWSSCNWTSFAHLKTWDIYLLYLHFHEGTSNYSSIV